MSSEPNHNRQKNHKALTKKQKEAIRRKKRQRKIILLVVEILVVLILAIALFLISKLGKIERQEVPLENIEVNEGISARIQGDYEELYYHCLIWSGQPL